MSKIRKKLKKELNMRDIKKEDIMAMKTVKGTERRLKRRVKKKKDK